ncbi:MAG: CerR family C-terminal domain-containing protein [Thermodesulfobacteriota bacterium]
MRKQRSDGLETREQLLAAASEIFAAKGFRAATIAEICKRARVNAAAASYHFGGKAALYVASWRYAFERSLANYPPDGGVPAGAPAGERLHGRILSLMRRITDPKSLVFDIAHTEMASPTGLLTETIRQSTEPIFQGLGALIRELLGPKAAEQQIRLCLMSIRAQCFAPLLWERRRKLAQPDRMPPGPEPLQDDVEALADHVTRFSLAGIREMRREAEGRVVPLPAAKPRSCARGSR